jgi:splicing factor 3B subunit 4
MSVAGGRITASAGVNLIGVHSSARNQEATCYVGNIDVQATEELIWELFVQAGPVGECRLNYPCAGVHHSSVSV